jgi:hypothetical protein
MIDFKIGTEYLDLPPDAKMRLVLNNPIFADGSLVPGDYSLPCEIPVGENSPKNTRILKSPQVIENNRGQRIFKNAVFMFDGCKIAKGDLNVTDVNDRKTSTNFLFGINALAKDFKSVKIRDICNDTVVISSNDFTKRVDIILRTNIFSGPFKVIVNDREYTGNNAHDMAVAINADTDDPRASAHYYSSAHPRYTPDASDYLTVQPYYNGNDIKTPFTVVIDDYDKIVLDTVDFETEYCTPIKNWLNTNFYRSVPLDARMYFPMMYNSKLYEPGVKNFFGSPTGVDYNFINTVFSSSGYDLSRTLTTNGATPFNTTSITPCIRLSWVLDRIASAFGIGLEGDFFADPDIDKAFFYHSNNLDVRVPFIGKVDWLACRRSFNTNEFLPDITAVDLLKSLQNRLNLCLYYNQKTRKLRMQKRDPVIKTPGYKDITSSTSTAGKIELNATVNVRLQAVKDTDDQIAVDDFYESGPQADVIIPTEISGMAAQQDVRVGGGGLRNMPVSARPFSTKIPVVLAFYEWKISGSVHYAGANIALSDGDFKFSGVNGLAAKRFGSYVRFLLRRKRISFTAKFPLGFITSLDWEQKVMVARQKYLIEKIEVPFSQQGIEDAEVTLLTV